MIWLVKAELVVSCQLLVVISDEGMRITNLNPDTEIGASAWLAEMDGNRVLMDAGTHPKREGRESLPLYPVVAHDAVDDQRARARHRGGGGKRDR